MHEKTGKEVFDTFRKMMTSKKTDQSLPSLLLWIYLSFCLRCNVSRLY